uniref:Ethanolaminephosphotransferase n=1 Tax=Arundo donax TaxID=35708 RepID=A0A0A9HWG4_ARUDO
MVCCSVQLFYKYTYSSYSQWTNRRPNADLLVPFFHLFHRS